MIGLSKHTTATSLISLLWIIFSRQMFCLNTFSDIIMENKTFYYQHLSTYPSKVVTVEYTVQYPKTFAHCGHLILDIYTKQKNLNRKTQCSNQKHGQLKNQNLRVPLVSPHVTCRQGQVQIQGQGQILSQGQAEIVSCSGETKIQGYIPRNFWFSIGFDCKWKRKVSLNGIRFNISSEQTNSTKCVQISEAEKQMDVNCSKFYSATTFPNFVGDQTLDKAVKSAKHFINKFKAKTSLYKYFHEFLCFTFFPKCNLTQNHLVLPCKEFCKDFRKAFVWISTVNQMDCDYFPSLNGTNPCFYERVTCELPKAPKTIFHEERNVYFAGSSVKYSGCVYTGKITKAGESREYFDGTATCLYSGKWLACVSPPAIRKTKNH